LGVYEVAAQIGKGGMGEVYRATDTKLKRQVAIKILLPSLAADRDGLARFQREAEVLAALNHPNIARIYGLDESGGITALVMELVEGDDLSQRIARGPIPINEALPIATQIAEAIEAAHERSIVHRDLKPANVKIKPDGSVRVLDFGLAKMGATLTTVWEHSPTFTMGATKEGTILGTAAYMSPEQARGKQVDKRSDIWAFGCVLYEMLTGRRAFAGTTLADVLGAVVKNEPDWTTLPRGTPPLVASLLRRCLQKDPVRRLHDIADARIEIQEAMFEPDTSDHHGSERSRPTRSTRAIPWIVAMLCALGLVLTQVWSNRAAAPDRPLTRLELTLPAGIEPYIGPSAVALSPDGTRFAFVGIDAGTRQVYLRRLDQFDAVPVRGTAGATAIFFSPEGRSIAVIQTDRTMKKVSLDDGRVATLAHEVDYTTGGVWGADGRITFGRRSVLWQVPVSGGVATQLTTLEAEKGELLHAFPTVVAGGLLFATVTGSGRGAAQIETLSLRTSIARREVVVDAGTSPAYVASGHLIFFRDGTLLAAPFDEERLRVTGPAVKLIDQIAVTTAGAPMLAISHSGTMAYMSGMAGSRLVWVSRGGLEQPLTELSRQYVFPRVAQDGKHVLVSAGGDLWIQDTARPTLARLTTEATTGNSYGVWTPDAKRVVFRTNTGLYLMEADGSGRSQRIPETTTADYPNSVSPDGETLIFLRTTVDKAADLYVLSLRGEPKPRPLVSTKAHEGGGQFSPDGKWVAYASDEFGEFQVFLRSFAGPDRKWLVSQAGKYPVWNRNGKELFYRDGNKMMAVNVSVRNGEPVFSLPQLLFDQSYEFGTGQTTTNYDVSPDGQRFLMVKSAAGARELNVVLNAFDDPVRLATPPQ
jgi:serine/threonine protein kinase/Tol biopolymer transport system component